MDRVIQAVRRHFLWAALFSALVNLLFLAPTIYMLQVYDRVVPTRGDMTLLFLTAVLIFALATLSALDFVRSRLLIRASVRLDRQLAGTLIAAALAPRPSASERANRQPIRECDMLRQSLTGPAIFSVFDAPWTPIYIAICALIHPAIGALALVGSIIILAIAWRSERSISLPLLRANVAANLSYAGQEQSLAGAEAIHALGMTSAVVKRHLAEREEMVSLQARASFAASRQIALSRFVRNALQSGALGLGALLAIDGRISGGAIFASSFLLGRAIAPIDQLVANWRTMIQARGALAAIRHWLRDDRLVRRPVALPQPAGRVAVERITVLDRGGRTILSDLSFSVQPGEMVAITGPSGAGKSTLARVIAGVAAHDRGVVRIDGAERTQWDGELLARHIGYLPQNLSLFAGTIRDNIARFADPGKEADAAAIAAAVACGVHDMILRLPQGYDTVLGWGGVGLSMGQTQRIAIARALFRQPSILILDEPNAHLDADGEAHLVRALVAAKQRGAAILVTAHRMGILAPADRILVLNQGRVERIGARDDVLHILGRKPASTRRAPVVAGSA